MAQACNTHTWEVDQNFKFILNYIREFKVRLRYMRPFLKNNSKETKQNSTPILGVHFEPNILLAGSNWQTNPNGKISGECWI